MKGKLIIGLVWGLVGWGWSGARAWAAPYFYLSPATGNYKVNDTFTVNLGVNTETEKSQAMDVWATFDASRLEVVSIVKAPNPPSSFSYSMQAHIDNSGGKFDIPFASDDLNTLNAQTVSGNLAVITLKAKAAGTGVVSFTCTTNETRDTNIFRSGTSTDVVSCSANVGGSYTILAEEGGSTSTPTPTSTSGPTSTSAPNATATPATSGELPQAGGAGATIGLIVFGLVSVISALALKLW